MVVKYIAFVLLIASALAQVPPGSPSITGPQIIIAGDSVTLICTVLRGDPTPTVKWFHNSNVIDNSSSVNGSVVTNTYSFQATFDQHQTVFECQSENGVLQNPLTTTIFVEVYTIPCTSVLEIHHVACDYNCIEEFGVLAGFFEDLKTWSPQQPVLTGSTSVVPGTTTTWTCLSTGAYAQHTMTMRMGNTQFNSSQFTTNTQYIASDDSYNVIGNLTFTPTTANNGQTLYCDYRHIDKSGNTPKTVSLLLSVTLSVPALTITSIIMSDAGSYICEATDGSAIVRTNNIQLSPIDGSACINPSTINLTDNQWSASTEYGSYTAEEGNLNGVGWSASIYDQFQYLKIDLEGVWQITRGLYSENNFEWIPYNSRLSSDIFGEQFERAGLDTNITFDPPIETRYIVFNPTGFYGLPSLKVELYGCHLKDQTKSVTQFSKDVETNTSWIPSQSPVIINKTIEIRPSVTLEIHAGVSVIFTKPDAGIQIYGSLITKGIPGLTAMFSSDSPVTILKNKWKGLELKRGGSFNISHSVIRQGDICVQGTSEHMDINFAFFYSCDTALRVSEGINLTVINEEPIPDTAYKIRNSEFIYNRYGIQFLGTTENPSLFIKKCNISLSSGFGIQISNWFNRALSDVLSRLYIDMSFIESNYDGIYSGSTGLASIFVNNTVIKGHIGIYSFQGNAYSYSENITIINSELSSVYMECYLCYNSFLKIINTTFECNFHRSVRVYNTSEVRVSIIGNSFHNCNPALKSPDLDSNHIWR
ncbi:unnamed protein product [Mytilus edulis]|uniref:Uncharacterized protein n=1 Tax=Mytilus edulis TaxID=6550 RepID=A0A8S3UG65_MYTED|nr:unnamed protein product [Mytilus edulis]